MGTGIFLPIVGLLMFFLYPSNASAYLDPGTGSMMIQALIALLAAGGLALGMFRDKVRVFLRRIFRRSDPPGNVRSGQSPHDDSE